MVIDQEKIVTLIVRVEKVRRVAVQGSGRIELVITLVGRITADSSQGKETGRQQKPGTAGNGECS